MVYLTSKRHLAQSIDKNLRTEGKTSKKKRMSERETEMSNGSQTRDRCRTIREEKNKR